MTLCEPAHCKEKQLVNAGWLTGWGISQGPSLGDRIKKPNNKAVHADPSQFYVRSLDLFVAPLVRITCFIGCLTTNVKHLVCTDYAIMEKAACHAYATACMMGFIVMSCLTSVPWLKVEMSVNTWISSCRCSKQVILR